MNRPYQPSSVILDRYARVLVNFALNSGLGVKKGEVVRLSAQESAKPLYVAVRNQILRSGAHPLSLYHPGNTSREFYDLANRDQLAFFPKTYFHGMAKAIDHSINIVSDTDLHELEGIAPDKIMLRAKSQKPFKNWLDTKENRGKFTWTIALYGTPALAKEAGISLKSYWGQIIRACFLDYSDPISKWHDVFVKNDKIRASLNKLKINNLRVQGADSDLLVGIGPNRKWLGGSGRNIPSFEIFTSPDWRGTTGHIKFNQPLYRYGSRITGIELEFKNGIVVKSHATQNNMLLQKILAVKNSNKAGEFSLTDKRLSRIDHFMAETLYDENISGPFGNTHIALGDAYKDAYTGDPGRVSGKDWARMGFNDCAIHNDIISTTDRTVTAYLSDGTQKVIYKSGRFVL